MTQENTNKTLGTPPSPSANNTSSSASVIVPPVIDPRMDTNALPPHPKTSAKARNLAFSILMLSTVCLGLGQTILFAILPPIARKIGLEDIQVGFIFTISALMWVLLSPIWGRKSDVIGRKPILLLGVGMFAISLAILGTIMELSLRGYFSATMAFILMAAFRSMHGIFASAGPAAAQAYVADRTTTKERPSSLAAIAASFGLGAIIGPGIGSATSRFGLTVPLFIVVAIAVVSFLAIFLFLPERSKPIAPKTKTKLKFTDKRLRALLFYGMGCGVLLVVPAQLVGFYLIDRLQLDDTTASQFLGIAYMVSSMSALFSQLVIIQRFKLSSTLLLQTAPLLVFAGFIIIAFGADYGAYVFGLLIAGLGTGLLLPSSNALISLSVSAGEQGNAAGLANSAPATGFIFGPPLAFGLYDISPQTPFILAALFALSLSLFARIITRKMTLAEDQTSPSSGS